MQTEELFEEGEEIVTVIRKHVFVYIQDFLFYTFACVMFMVVAALLSHFGGVAGEYLSIFFGVLTLLTWVAFFGAWTNHYFDVWYVTNRHIVAVNQKELLDREVAFMEFKRIQDVLFEKNGFLESWFGYGTVRVQSAGKEQEFVLTMVKDVEDTVHRIMELRDKGNGAAL